MEPIRNTLPSLALLTVDQVAELLQCAPSTVEKYIRSGELPRVAISPRLVDSRQSGPRAWRIYSKDLEAFINSRRRCEPQKPAAAVPVPEPRVFLPSACGTDGKDRLALKRPMATGTDGKSRLRLPKRAL